MADARIQARIDYLKKNRPKDPEIAKLQAKLGSAPGAAAPPPPIDTKAIDYASDIAAGSGVSKPFAPELDPRMGTGDLIADRKRQEAELGEYLGRDLDAEYAKAREMTEQKLFNQGIPVGSQQYKDQIAMLDDAQGRKQADIRAQSLQFGGQEMDRSFGMGEQRRANQLSEQVTTNQTNVGNAGAMSDIDLAYKQLAENKRQANMANRINKGQLGIQRQALGNRGGSGGGGQRQAVAQSPFVDG